MKKNYFVFAMKRSGHHVLVNWIARNDGNCRHENNVSGRSGMQSFKGSSTTLYGNSPDKNLIANFEDFRFHLFDQIKWPNKGNSFYILFMRDFPNWLASSYKRKDAKRGRHLYDDLEKPRGKDYPSRIEIYRRHSQIFSAQDPRLILVSYNRFLTSPEYRNQLAERLGLKNIQGEKKLSQVTNFGQGSSFTGTDQTEIKTKDVFSRFVKYVDDERFQKLLQKNQDLIDFSEKFLTKGIEKGPSISA